MDPLSEFGSEMIASCLVEAQLIQRDVLSSVEAEEIPEISLKSFPHSSEAKLAGSNLSEDVSVNESTIRTSAIKDGHIEFEPNLSELNRSTADTPSLASIAASTRYSEELLTDSTANCNVVDVRRDDNRLTKIRLRYPRRCLQRIRAKRVEKAKVLLLRDKKTPNHVELLLLQQRVRKQEMSIIELERRIAESTKGIEIMADPDRVISPPSHLPLPSTSSTLHPVVVIATLSSKGSMTTCITESASYNCSTIDFLIQQETIAPTISCLSPIGFDLEPLQKPTNDRNHRQISAMAGSPVFTHTGRHEDSYSSYTHEYGWHDGEVEACGNAADEISLSEYIDDVADNLQERSRERDIQDYYQHGIETSSILNTVEDRRSLSNEEASFSNLDALEEYREDEDEDVASPSPSLSPTPDERHMQIWNRFFSNAMKTELPIREGSESTRSQNSIDRGDRISSRGSNLKNGDSRQNNLRDTRNYGDVVDSSAVWQDRMQEEDFADYPASSPHEEEEGALGEGANFLYADEVMFGAASSAEGRSDLLLSAVLRCDLEEVEELLSLGADPNHHTAGKLQSRPYAHIAARYGFDYSDPSEYGAEVYGDDEKKERGARCLALLAEYGADLDAVDAMGQSAVHVAAEIGNYAALEYLLESAVNAKVEDSEGNSALHLAIKGGYFRCRDILLSYVTSPFPSPTPIPSAYSSSAIVDAIDKTSNKISSDQTTADDVIKIPAPTMMGRGSPSAGLAAMNRSHASAASVTSTSVQSAHPPLNKSEFPSSTRTGDALTSRDSSEEGRKSDAIVQEMSSNSMRQMLSSSKGAARDRLDIAISSARRRPTPSAESSSRRATMSIEKDSSRRKHNKSVSREALLRTSASHHRHYCSSDSDGSERVAQRYKHRESRPSQRPPSSTSCLKSDWAIGHQDDGGPAISTPFKRSQSGKESIKESNKSPERKSTQYSVEDAHNAWCGDGDDGNSPERYYGSSRDCAPSTPQPSRPQHFADAGSDERHFVPSAAGDSTAQRPIIAERNRSSRNENEDEEDEEGDDGGTLVSSDRVSEAVWYVASTLITFAHSMLFATGPVTHTVDQYEDLDDRQYSDRRISNERKGWRGGRNASLSANQHSAAYQQDGLSIPWDKQEGEAEREMSGPPTDAHLKNRGLGFDYNVTSTPPPLVAQDILVAKSRGGVIMGESLRPPSEVSVAIAAAAGRNLSLSPSTRHDSSHATSSFTRKYRVLDTVSNVNDINVTPDRDGGTFPDLTLHDAVSPVRPPISPLPSNGYSMGAMPAKMNWRYVDVLQSRNTVLDRKGS